MASILSLGVEGDAEAKWGRLTLSGCSSPEPADVAEIDQTQRGSNQNSE